EQDRSCEQQWGGGVKNVGSDALRARVVSLALTCALAPACRDEEPVASAPDPPVTRGEPSRKPARADRSDLNEVVSKLRRGNGDYVAPSSQEARAYVEWFTHLSA